MMLNHFFSKMHFPFYAPRLLGLVLSVAAGLVSFSSASHGAPQEMQHLGAANKLPNFVMYPDRPYTANIRWKGDTAYVCVMSTPSRAAGFWNPVDDTQTIPSPSNCMGNDPIALQLRRSFMYGTREGLSGEHSQPNARFGSNSIITSTNLQRAPHCRMNFYFYYTVSTPGQMARSFYLLMRLKRPMEYEANRYCENSTGKDEHFSQPYDAPLNLQTAPLTNGMTLFVDQPDGMALAMSNVPTSVIALDRSAYIVPEPLLRPILDNAGYGLKARYDAVMAYIKANAVKAQ